MKQWDLFGSDSQENKTEEQYTSKIKAPVYEPKRRKPHPLELYDNIKANRLINEIQSSDVDPDTKKFLIEAAKRHIVFNYEKIADFNAHSDEKVQDLMEKSALVIIDFDKAITYGYARLSQEIANQYLSDFEDEK